MIIDENKEVKEVKEEVEEEEDKEELSEDLEEKRIPTLARSSVIPLYTSRVNLPLTATRNSILTDGEEVESIKTSEFHTSFRDIVDFMTMSTTDWTDLEENECESWLSSDEDDERGEFEYSFMSESPEELNPERLSDVMSKMKWITIIASIGGFLSGYNIGVIPGALLPVRRYFDLTKKQSERVVTSMIFSAFVASVGGGILNNQLGRRKALLISALAFALSSLILYSAESPQFLFWGEVLAGGAIGVESMTTPVYIAEIVTPDLKLTAISIYCLMVMVGEVVAAVIDGFLGTESDGWRYMFGVAFFPSLILFFGFLCLPQSPAWLIKNNKRVTAQRILEKYRASDAELKREMIEVDHNLTFGGYDWTRRPLITEIINMLRHKHTRKMVRIGSGLMLLQQICGINSVIYYSASICHISGFTESESIWLSCLTVFAQILGQSISLLYCRKVKKRFLVIMSLILVFISSLGLAISFFIVRFSSASVDIERSAEQCIYQPAWLWNGVTRNCYDCTQISACGFCNGVCISGSPFGPDMKGMCKHSDSQWSFDYCENPHKWVTVFFLVSYVFVFGLGLASIPWVVNSELYPIQHRSLAVGISTAMNWFGNLVVSSYFLEFIGPRKLTAPGVFFLYSIISVVGAVWIYFVLPETGDRTVTVEETDDVNGKDSDRSGEFEPLSSKKIRFKPYDTIISVSRHNSQRSQS